MSEQLGMMPVSDNKRPDLLWRISGRLTALFVHEINNDLATLREKSGLAEDVLAARKIAASDKLKNMGEIINACEGRLNQAVLLVRNFSEIGKDMESDSETVDLGGLLASLSPFFTKIARQQLLTLRMTVRQGLFVVAARPYPLLCCLLAVFENQCCQSVPRESILVEAEQDPSSITLSLCKTAARATQGGPGMDRG